jgi:PilZ domain
MKLAALPERRKTPRTKVEAITYISFDGDNGGILSNISEEGLCFHAARPVQQTERLRVRFSVNGRPIEAYVELIWLDETQKTGGFRFISLSPETCKQIGQSISGSTGLAAAPVRAVRSVPKTRAVRALNASGSDRFSLRRLKSCSVMRVMQRLWFAGETAKIWSKVSALAVSTYGFALRVMGGLRRVSWPRTEAACVRPSLQSFPAQKKAAATWFFRGLLSGLLIGALVGATLQLSIYRRQFGELLIEFGGRLAAKPAQTVPLAPARNVQ